MHVTRIHRGINPGASPNSRESSMRTLITAFVLAGLASMAHAEDLGRVALVQALKDATCPLTLMCVAAHPDDEDGATLAYYRMKYGVRTVAVIATRGEGGQNEIGPELYGELGAIRTREMMNAAKVEGSELRFLNLPEFGFSKSAEETLEKWGHDVALKRMRALIDEYQPDVIITHHGLMKDHGHHQAIGQILLEAVQEVHEDHPGAHYAQALYVRKFEGGPDTIKIDLGELEPVRGVTYAQVAARALEEHKSQGMKLFIDRYLSGRPQAQYTLRVRNEMLQGLSSLHGLTAEEYGPLFEGVHTNLNSMELDALARDAEKLNGEEVLKALGALPDLPDLELLGVYGDRLRLREAASIAAELRLAVKPSDTTVVRGQQLSLNVSLTDFGAADVGEAKLTLQYRRDGLSADLESRQVSMKDNSAAETFTFPVSAAAAYTVPNAEHFSDDYLLAPQFFVSVEGKTNGGASFARTVPIYVDVAPATLLAFESAPYLLDASGTATARLRATNATPGAAQAEVSIEVPEGWTASPAKTTVAFGAEDEERTLAVTLKAPRDFSGSATIGAVVVGGEHKTSTNVVGAQVALPKKAKVGLIRSYDDTLEATLRKLGVAHGLITPENFSAEALAQYTTIIVDMRAYAYRPDLVANNQALFDFARNGGTVIVLYQKTFDWKPAYAPFKLEVANNRVTREDAAMTLLHPEHPLFNKPNKINPADWDGWIQERGLYFAGTWGPEFTPLLACNDPGEDLPPGALLSADLGKGKYVYCALALYRQLRELNPGALRLFANLIAY